MTASIKLSIIVCGIIGLGYLVQDDAKEDILINETIIDNNIVVAPIEKEIKPCRDDMIFINGNYCINPKHICLEWKEDPANTQFARCQRYEENVKCRGGKEYLSFCIDKYEFAGKDNLPVGNVSWTYAKETCNSLGKRLCKEKEWTFACEGEEMRPYPYGFVRDSKLCNFDVERVLDINGALIDKRKSIYDNPECKSPFGVINMVGNIDEWVVSDKPYYSKDGTKIMSSLLKGGWYAPLRNRCRPRTEGHNHLFKELQTGFRCCSDINK